MNFADAMKIKSTEKLTENGAFAYNRLNSSLVELFAQIGALRPRTEEEIRQKFRDAYYEDKELAIKMLFYAGNIRGGLGERRTFQICLHELAILDPEIVEQNIHNVPHYNRWDSLFCLTNTPVSFAVWNYIFETLINDCKNMTNGKPVSLLAKWLPSEKAHSQKTRNLYHQVLKATGMPPRLYRKVVSRLRKYIDVTECKMSDNKWEDIKYPTVPAKAMNNYHHAFAKHDINGFEKYMLDVKSGEQKINASTLFPYDLVRKYTDCGIYLDSVVEEQWKALPNYIEGENNVVIMADVSGSMYGRPMETSVGLAIYFAERNSGLYKNTYMTFTDRPHFIYLTPNHSLRQKVDDVMNRDVGYSTNLEAAFNEILNTALQAGVSDDEMPRALVIISDMEIDRYMRGRGLDFIEEMKYRFWDKGYTLPRLVLWNVEARQDTYLTQSEDVIMVSGQSPSVFRSFIGALNGETRYDIMLKTLNDPMYDRVVTTI